MMSAVGLGLSLADRAIAHEAFAVDADAVPAAGPAIPVWREPVVSGGLDEYQTVAHDRHAVALALVLMADADTPTFARPRIAPSHRAWAGATARHLRYSAARSAAWQGAPRLGVDSRIEPVAGEPGLRASVQGAAKVPAATIGVGVSGAEPRAAAEPLAGTEIAAVTPIEPAVMVAASPVQPVAAPSTESAAPAFSSMRTESASRVGPPRRKSGDEPWLPAPSIPFADVVVASHVEQVLMSLAAIASADTAAESRKFGALPRATVVPRHADRVLLDLASVRDRSLADPDPVAVAAARPRSAVASEPPAISPFDGQSLAVSGDRLDGVRGGFVTAGGLHVSFGIERAVYLNGNLVTTTSLTLNELGKVSGTHGLPVSAEIGRALVQNGVGNTVVVPGGLSASALGTVIQNTLDNQKIQTVTKIDAAVSAAAVLRSMDLQSSMRGAISQSLQR